MNRAIVAEFALASLIAVAAAIDDHDRIETGLRIRVVHRFAAVVAALIDGGQAA